jgi:hypothetical protein
MKTKSPLWLLRLLTAVAFAAVAALPSESVGGSGNADRSPALAAGATRVSPQPRKARSPDLGTKAGSKALLPPFTEPLLGTHIVRVVNPNSTSATAGLRLGDAGVDWVIPANGQASVRVPNGRYDIYFLYADQPDALFQGDSFSLQNNGVEIRLVKVVNGNYGIRRVR